ncbi:MAG: DUF2635 domain-containing protein [Castellaniella sp.]|nr:DUF2635 domain-containing protein [Castellaniella sp.]
MYVKPKAGLRVIDPVRKQFMPDEGMQVDDFDLYWVRRLRDGDVVRANPPATQSASDAPAMASKGSK